MRSAMNKKNDKWKNLFFPENWTIYLCHGGLEVLVHENVKAAPLVEHHRLNIRDQRDCWYGRHLSCTRRFPARNVGHDKATGEVGTANAHTKTQPHEQWFADLLVQFDEEFKKKGPRLANKKVLLHHNNAPAHLSAIVTTKAVERRYE